MNFFEDQRKAKKKSNSLYALFMMVITGVALCTGAIVVFAIRVQTRPQRPGIPQDVFDEQTLFSPENLTLFLSSAAIVAAIILLITLFKIMQLKMNPEGICESMGAIPLGNNPSNFKDKQYRNIVQEMSIASSVPVPAIYILEDSAINAFACGYDINSAAICVTTGAIDSLSRDELQAVVAHEYSHILNGDMNINLKLVGMLAGVLSLYYIGRQILRSTSRGSKKEGNQLALLGFGIMALGLIGYFFGSLLKAALSRQREYLADASSVQFTRNPDGMSNALKKILVHSEHGLITSDNADQAAHMFLVEGVAKSFFSFDSHPDIHQRIKAIDRHYDQKKFMQSEFKEIAADIKKQHKSIEAPIDESLKKKESPKKQIERLMPLMLLYQTSIKSSGKDIKPEELLRRFIANQDPEITSLSAEKKLEILEVLHGEIKSFSPEKKEQMHQIVKEEINRDGKFDFKEFVIYAYLRPALKNIKISTTHLSKSEFEKYGNYVLTFLFKMDENELTKEMSDKLSNYFPFKPIDTKLIKYSTMLKVFEKIRFTNIDQKEKLILACKELIDHNGHQSEKELIILRLIKQMISVPGIA